VIIIRVRSSAEINSIYAPANASGDRVPGGSDMETAVWFTGRTGTEVASSDSGEGVLDASATGMVQPAPRSGSLGEVRVQPRMGITAASRMVNETTTTWP
jgi:hypothetical protein